MHSLRSSPRVLPARPAQIAVGNLAPSVSRRLASAQTCARATAGGLLMVGAGVVGVTAFVDGPALAVLALVWVVTLAAARLAWSGGFALGTSTTEGASPWATAVLYGGVAIIAPLSLHALVAAHLWAPDLWHSIGRGHGREMGTFAAWVRASVALTAPAHVMFAALATWRGATSGRETPPRPKLLTIWFAVVVVTLPDVLVWALFGLFPVAYVFVSAAVLLVALAWWERRQ